MKVSKKMVGITLAVLLVVIGSGNLVEADNSYGAGVKLTVNCPQQIVQKQAVKFSGQAGDGIYKVILSVDGYKIGEARVVNGQYNLQYSFHQAGTNRRLVVNAFDIWGRSVRQIARRIDVQPANSGGSAGQFGSKFADYANNNWRSLKQEA